MHKEIKLRSFILAIIIIIMYLEFPPSFDFDLGLALGLAAFFSVGFALGFLAFLEASMTALSIFILPISDEPAKFKNIDKWT